MANIVFILSHLSHQNATFGLAKILAKHNHHVVYSGPRIGIDNHNLKSTVIREGFSFEEMRLYTTNGLTIKNEEQAFADYCDSLLTGRPFIQLVRKINPQLILLDIHYAVFAIVFYSLKIPIVFVSTELLTEEDVSVPPLYSDLIPEPTKDSRDLIQRQWNEYYEQRNLSSGFMDFLQGLSDQHQFPFNELFNARRCIVPFGFSFPEIILWPREFDFERSDAGLVNKFYLGALVDLDRKETIQKIPKLQKAKRRIYCSMGTRENSNKVIKHQFLNKLIELFTPLSDYEVIIVTGENFKLSVKHKLPSTLILMKSAPQLSILKHCDLMINHAGGNSIKECLTLGVPMLCVPSDNDQFGNAARVVYYQVGLQSRLDQFSPEDILVKIKRLLGDKIFKVRLKAFQKVFQQGNDGKLALKLVESFIVNNMGA